MKKESKWTFVLLQLEALKYKTKKEFYTQGRAAYKAAHKQSVLVLICEHMETINRKPFTVEEIKKEALLYSRRVDFQRQSKSEYGAARRMGILDQVCSHMALEWQEKWSTETISQEALKYNHRGDFFKFSGGAYDAARKMGILDSVCSHMILKYEKWTPDRIKKEALKYQSRGEMQLKSPQAYDYAHSKGLLETVCSHMKLSKQTSFLELELLEQIRKLYPKAQKLRDREVKMSNKPHIKGFDIDIYVPELRKGIEFDGHYWHSVDGLRRSRQDWPQEDLENYHQIKDDYFKSREIEILHISEKDWIEDKQKCINECLSFLLTPNLK